MDLSRAVCSEATQTSSPSSNLQELPVPAAHVKSCLARLLIAINIPQLSHHGQQTPFLLSIPGRGVFTDTSGCSSSAVPSPALTQQQNRHRSNPELPKRRGGPSSAPKEPGSASLPVSPVPEPGTEPCARSPSAIDHPDTDSLVPGVIRDNLPAQTVV